MQCSVQPAEVVAGERVCTVSKSSVSLLPRPCSSHAPKRVCSTAGIPVTTRTKDSFQGSTSSSNFLSTTTTKPVTSPSQFCLSDASCCYSHPPPPPYSPSPIIHIPHGITSSSPPSRLLLTSNSLPSQSTALKYKRRSRRSGS